MREFAAVAPGLCGGGEGGVPCQGGGAVLAAVAVRGVQEGGLEEIWLFVLGGGFCWEGEGEGEEKGEELGEVHCVVLWRGLLGLREVGESSACV